MIYYTSNNTKNTTTISKILPPGRAAQEKSHGSFHFTQRIPAYRGPAGGDRRFGQGLRGGRPVSDFARCYRLRQDLYHGKCHCKA